MELFTHRFESDFIVSWAVLFCMYFVFEALQTSLGCECSGTVRGGTVRGSGSCLYKNTNK